MAELFAQRVLLGITGASGAPYAVRVIELLTEAEFEVHLAVSTLGRRLLFEELGLKHLDGDALSGGRGGQVVSYGENDLGAAIASGSFRHRGMIIVPASSNTVAAIAGGLTRNLLQRAAAVTLKERRPLIVAHRETPLTLIDLRNLVRLTEAGAVVAPLSPGFYLQPRTIEDLVDFMAGRLLDLLGVAHTVEARWEEV